jgi:hypothetical protein
VTLSDLDPDASEVLLKYGFGQGISPFHGDILFAVENSIDPELWQARRMSMKDVIKDEDHWTEQILGLRVDDFLRFYAALLPQDGAAAPRSESRSA